MLSCTKIEGRVDGEGANVTAALVFELSYVNKQDKPIIGTVFVHLHHTTRRVQLQGSSMVHGKVRAPVWFADKVLKGIFGYLAKDKGVDITNFNITMNDLLTDHINKVSSQDKCGSCKLMFDGRASPESCESCKKKFHRRCFHDRLHLCPKQPRNLSRAQSLATTVSTILGPITGTNTLTFTAAHGSSTSLSHTTLTDSITASSSHTGSPPTSTDTVQARRSHNMHPGLLNPQATPYFPPPTYLPQQQSVPPPTTDHTQSRSTEQQGSLSDVRVLGIYQPTCQSSAASLSVTPEVPIPSTSAPVSAPCTSDAHPTPQQQRASAATRTKTNRKKLPDPASQNLDLEYTKAELNTAQASIIVLESTIRDLRFKNSILEDRVKQLDNQKKTQIFDRYFPTSQQQTVPPNLPSSHQLPCCHYIPHCHNYGSHGRDQMEKVFEAIDSLKIEIDAIKNKLDNSIASTESCPASVHAQPPPSNTLPVSSPPHRPSSGTSPSLASLHRPPCTESEQRPQRTEPSPSQANPQLGGHPPSPRPGHGLDNDRSVLGEDLDISVVSIDQVMEEFNFSSDNLN